MCAYNGWACCIEAHASKQEVLDVVKEVFFLELAIKGRVIIQLAFSLTHFFFP